MVGSAGVYVALVLVVVSGLVAFLFDAGRSVPWDLVVCVAALIGFLTYALGQAKPVREGIREIVPAYESRDLPGPPEVARALKALRWIAEWGGLVWMLQYWLPGLPDVTLAVTPEGSVLEWLDQSVAGFFLALVSGAIVISWAYGPPATLLPFATAPALASLGALWIAVPMARRLVLHVGLVPRAAAAATAPLRLPIKLSALCVVCVVGLIFIFHGRALRDLAAAPEAQRQGDGESRTDPASAADR